MDVETANAKLGLSRRAKGWVAVAAALVVAVLGVLIVRAFAPGFAAKVSETVLNTFTVTITAPPDPPPPEQPKAAGDRGDAGKKAVPRETKVPEAKVAIAKVPAPKASSTGAANTSGAADQGSGTGAGGNGSGTGAGGSGSGPGGGKPTKAEHIGGQINNARDFPIPPGGREARVGKTVVLDLSISPGGRVTNCKVYKSSGFPETDATACILATQRLRFKPATNAAGEPVPAIFRWVQKFFF
jgi:protein TonB